MVYGIFVVIPKREMISNLEEKSIKVGNFCSIGTFAWKWMYACNEKGKFHLFFLLQPYDNQCSVATCMMMIKNMAKSKENFIIHLLLVSAGNTQR